jgi:hypothetical protein
MRSLRSHDSYSCQIEQWRWNSADLLWQPECFELRNTVERKRGGNNGYLSETFLRKVPTEVKISKEEIGDLSRKDINGRQVRRSQLSEGVTVIPQLTDITV